MSLTTNCSLLRTNWDMGWPQRTSPISKKEQAQIQKQFKDAVVEGNFYRAEHLLGTGIERGAKIDEGEIPVLLEVICLNEPIEAKIKKLQFLRQHGANFNVVNLHGATALHLAAFRGDADLLTYLLETEINDLFEKNLKDDLQLFLQDKSGNTALHEIIRNPKLDSSIIDLWVDAGGPIEIQNNNGETPLTLCCLLDDFEKANTLLTRGDSSSFDLDKQGYSPFLIALMKCKTTDSDKPLALEFENLLYNMLTIPDIETEANIGLGLTPLLGISKVPDLPDHMSLLITQGADVNAKDPRNGNTALHNAARIGDKFYVLSLLDKLEEIDSQNNFGKTPLEEALHMGHTEIAKILSCRTTSGLEPIQEEEIEGSL